MTDTQKPYDLKKRCYLFSRGLIDFIKVTEYERIHFSLFDQLLRCGTSIGANVVEGSSGSSKKDLINFYHIALKSANETKYWLCLLRDSGLADRIEVNELVQEADELSKIVASSIIKMKKRLGFLQFLCF
ncbi:MAG: four helix bundle protein [Bacteroidota bacterium]